MTRFPKISETAIAAWGAAKARLSGARLIDLWTRAQTLLYFEEQLAMAAKQQQASNPSIFTRYAGPMAQVFSRTKDAAKEGAKDLPVGSYTCRLKSLKLKEYDVWLDGKKTGNKTLGALGQFTVILGDHTGESAPWFPKDFDNEERFLYFLRDCVRMGLDVDSIDMTNPATAMKNLDVALQELAKTRPAVEIVREEWEGKNGKTGINTKVKNRVSEDQVEAMGGVRIDQAGDDNGGDPAEMSDEVLPPDEDETPAPAAPVARTPKAAAGGNGKAAAKPATKAATPPAPAATTRPPKQAPAVTAPKRQEQPVDLDVGGDDDDAGEIEDVTDEGEIEDVTEPTIDVGSRVQLSVRGTVKTGIIKREDNDDASKWIIKDEASSSMWRIPKDEPSLVLAD